MKIFSLKNLCRLRLVFMPLFLVVFTLIFSGLIIKQDLFFNLAKWQFIPRVLSAVALSGITTFSAMMLVAIITAFCGRIYCSWVCPLGLMQDIIERMNHKFFQRDKVRKYRKPRLALRLAVAVFVFILFFSGFALLLGYLEPYSLFGKIASGLFQRVLTFFNDTTAKMPQNEIPFCDTMSIYLAVSGGVLLALVALAVWKGRIFCNTLCPTGTLLAGLSARSGRRLAINSEKCIECGKCEKVCNAHCINSAEKRIDFVNCFMCLECKLNCPENAIEFVRRRKGGYKDADLPEQPELRKALITAGVAGAGAFALGKMLFKDSAANSAEEGVVVPPGAGSVDNFLAHCTGCGLCMSNCHGGCLQPASTEYGWRGFMLPVMKFSGSKPGKCEYECNKCTQICPTGALRPLSLKYKKRCRIGIAEFFQDECIAYKQGKPCGACAEHCPTGALTMTKVDGKNAFIPAVNIDLCIGCGNCEYACPVKPAAIRVFGVKQHNMAEDPVAYRANERTATAPADFSFLDE